MEEKSEVKKQTVRVYAHELRNKTVKSALGPFVFDAAGYATLENITDAQLANLRLAKGFTVVEEKPPVVEESVFVREDGKVVEIIKPYAGGNLQESADAASFDGERISADDLTPPAKMKNIKLPKKQR